MMMVPYDDWVDGVNTSIASRHDSASNIPRVVIVRAIRSAVRRFLVDSNVWVHKVALPKKYGDTHYSPLPVDTFICKAWDSNDCNQYALDELTYSHPNILNTKELRDRNIENIDVSLSVTQDSMECPLFIYDRYYDGILSGALSSLQAMPGKAWSDPSMVEYHEAMFDRYVTKAQSDSRNGLLKRKPKNSISPNFM